MNDEPFAPIGPEPMNGTVVMPVPSDAPPPPTAHPTLGKPTKTWPYTDAAGRVLYYQCRYDGPAGKEFLPLTCWQLSGGGLRWRRKSPAPPRPLYGLRELAERPSAPVAVCEGEKACDAARCLLPGFVVVTSPNGSKSARKTDWSPLRGRIVTIWPDADRAGFDYARAAAEAALLTGAASVAIVASPPEKAETGWDAADALIEGWDGAQAIAFLGTAVPFEIKSNSETKPQHRAREQRADFIEQVIAIEGVELWRDAGGETYATVPINKHVENWPLRSTGFKRWLSGFYHDERRGTLTTQAMEDMLRTFDIKAYKGAQYRPFVRVGECEGKLYHDLCDDRWRCAEVTSNGWTVIEKAPVKFLRSPSMRHLPEPKRADGQYGFELLRRFMPSISSERDFILIGACCLASLRPRGPFPILIVNGTQDSGKTVICQMIRLLIDPDEALLCAVPKDERDFFLSASNIWISGFDNLSAVRGFLPDA
jgi:hypothetical protein